MIFFVFIDIVNVVSVELKWIPWIAKTKHHNNVSIGTIEVGSRDFQRSVSASVLKRERVDPSLLRTIVPTSRTVGGSLH